MTDVHSATLTMTVGEWRVRLAELCQASALAEPGEEDAMLRLGHDLLANQPDPHSRLADHLPPAARFEALLAAGAHDSAAVALMPETGSYIVSRAGEGGCMASVMLPGMEEEVTSEADSSALALMSALAAALAAVGTQAAQDVAPWTSMMAYGDGPSRCGDVACDVDDWNRPQGAALH